MKQAQQVTWGYVMIIEIDIRDKGIALLELDGRNPKIAEQIATHLPITSKINAWQDEIYFELPFQLSDENVSSHAQKGDVSYWTPGSAFCVFFGESQPISPVNHIGKIISGFDQFPLVKEGELITLRIKEQG